MYRLVACSFAVSAALLAPACGSSGGRAGVSGTVTFRGKPLVHGTIQFQPTPGGPGTMTGAPVIDGRYAVDPKKGLLPGAYTVHVSCPVENPPKPGHDKSFREDIPEKYNAATTLRAEVTSSGPNVFDFKLD